MEILNLFLKNMKKHILTGLKIYKIGVFQDNFGGDIEFQHIIVRIVRKLLFQKKR